MRTRGPPRGRAALAGTARNQNPRKKQPDNTSPDLRERQALIAAILEVDAGLVNGVVVGDVIHAYCCKEHREAGKPCVIVAPGVFEFKCLFQRLERIYLGWISRSFVTWGEC